MHRLRDTGLAPTACIRASGAGGSRLRSARGVTVGMRRHACVGTRIAVGAPRGVVTTMNERLGFLRALALGGAFVLGSLDAAHAQVVGDPNDAYSCYNHCGE